MIRRRCSYVCVCVRCPQTRINFKYKRFSVLFFVLLASFSVLFFHIFVLVSVKLMSLYITAWVGRLLSVVFICVWMFYRWQANGRSPVCVVLFLIPPLRLTRFWLLDYFLCNTKCFAFPYHFTFQLKIRITLISKTLFSLGWRWCVCASE